MVKRSFIIIAALVLAAATAGCAAGPQEYVTIPAPMATQANETAAPVESTPMSTLTAEPTNEPTPEPTPGIQEAIVGFVGDILMMTRQIADAKTETGYDFTESFLPMKSVFESVDIMCADFEGTFGGEEAGYTQPRETIAPATEENPNPTNPPMQSFSAPDELAKNLPYGEQRHLEIARAMATNPALLLLDEPAAGMNPAETAELTNLIAFIREHYHLTILLIEHDMSLVMKICERIYVLDYGMVIANGTPDEIKSNRKVIEAYLGEDVNHA
mgnify:CR=1 FL=1